MKLTSWLGPTLIVFGLALFVLWGLLRIPMLITSSRRYSHRHPTLPVRWVAAFSAAGILWECARFYEYSRWAVEDGHYTGAGVTIFIAPLFALWGGFLAAAAGWGLGTLMRHKRSPRHVFAAALALLCGAGLIGREVVNHRYDHVARNVARERIREARAPSVTAIQIEAILDRYEADTRDAKEVEALAANPACPEPVLRRLAAYSGNLKMIVARNPKAPTDLLIQLAKDPYDYIRWFAAGNQNTPVDVLEALSSDPSRTVSESAQRQLNLAQRAKPLIVHPSLP